MKRRTLIRYLWAGVIVYLMIVIPFMYVGLFTELTVLKYVLASLLVCHFFSVLVVGT